MIEMTTQPGQDESPEAAETHRVDREEFLALVTSHRHLVRLPELNGYQRVLDQQSNELFEVSEQELYPPIKFHSLAHAG